MQADQIFSLQHTRCAAGVSTAESAVLRAQARRRRGVTRPARAGAIFIVTLDLAAMSTRRGTPSQV